MRNPEYYSLPPESLEQSQPPSFNDARGGCLTWFSRSIPVIIIGLLALCFVGAASVLVVYAAYANDLPPAEQLGTSKLDQSTKIYARDGQTLLFEIFDPNGGRRTIVQPNRIPLVMKQAIIATEDPSFYSNVGVDFYAVARAVYYLIRYQRVLSGGSTLTQQLVRNSLITAEPTVDRKIKEAILALEVTRRYSKDEILAKYLNTIFFGNLSYGIEAASQSYFNKDIKDLNLAEASLLAGLPQSPSAYDPCQNPDAALDRQQIVLGLMREAGYVNSAQAAAAQREMTIRLNSADFVKQCKSSLAFKAPHFVNYVRKVLEQQFGTEVVYKGGLQVTTTLDPQMQAIVEEEAKKQIDVLKGKNVTNAAAVLLNPHTGEVLAMLGSVDFNNKDIDGQVNVADRLRQPGSSIKPINYVTAFSKKGWTPATPIYDLKTDFPDGNGRPPYTPVNYDGRDHGIVTARTALANSLNVPAVKTLYATSTLDQYGYPHPFAMIETASKLGITTFTDAKGTPKTFGLALTLGGGDIKLTELTGAYSAFSNLGARMPLTPISKIVDGNGRVLFDLKTKDKPKAQCAQFDPDARDEQPDANNLCAKSAPYSYLVTSILSDNDARGLAFGLNTPLKLCGDGTSTCARTGIRPTAVKTGTTNDFKDNWTIGYTPEVALGVWVGNSNATPMKDVTGITGAAPIWHNVLARLYKETDTYKIIPAHDFPVPGGLVRAEICTDSGLLATELCPPDHRRVETFVANHAPTQKDSVWQKLKIDKRNGLLASDKCDPNQVEERVFQVPLHDVADVIPYDRILDLARKNGWQVPPQPSPCYEGEPTGEPTQTLGPTDTPQATPLPLLVTITRPRKNEIVRGPVQVWGYAVMQNFDRYQVAVRASNGQLSTLQVGRAYVAQESLLANWDTQNFPDGSYTIILVIWDHSNNSETDSVPVILQNGGVSPTPTPTRIPLPTSTPIPTTLPTSTHTPKPANTPKPTNTLTPPVNTPTKTFTPCPTFTPTP
ncbi:MAG TPA: transglycosylase domain-containing protein, partial [Anaerolineae bacterium]